MSGGIEPISAGQLDLFKNLIPIQIVYVF